MPSHYLITGATGFVGTHVAEACAERGHPLSAIARPTSKTRRLEGLGATIHRGDLADPDFVRQALEGADVIVHCAAKVGDWGPVEEYRTVNVDALRVLLEACKGRPLERFVHVSSLGVYAFRDHKGTDETEPLPAQHIDGYTQTKVEAEQLALQYHREHGVPVVVLRPGFIYGPNDRTVLPKLIDNLRRRKVRYVGSGLQRMNTIFVGNLVDAVFLAAEKPQAVGQVYNLTDGHEVTKKHFMETITIYMALPTPSRLGVPFGVAHALTRLSEWWARRRGAKEAPTLTMARLKFIGLDLDFSIAKARNELEYQPRITFDEAMPRTLIWYQKQEMSH